MEKPILVYYIDISRIGKENASDYIRETRNLVHDDNYVQYFIPIEGESRIECINPRLLTGKEYDKIIEILDYNKEVIKEFTKSNKLLIEM